MPSPAAWRWAAAAALAAALAVFAACVPSMQLAPSDGAAEALLKTWGAHSGGPSGTPVHCHCSQCV